MRKGRVGGKRREGEEVARMSQLVVLAISGIRSGANGALNGREGDGGNGH